MQRKRERKKGEKGKEGRIVFIFPALSRADFHSLVALPIVKLKKNRSIADGEEKEEKGRGRFGRFQVADSAFVDWRWTMV